MQQLGNRAEDWSLVQVSNACDLSLIRNNVFLGRVQLGAMEQGFVSHGDLRLPEGLYNSMLSDATVGDRCAVHNVHMLSGYTVGDHCLLFNIDEMTATAPNVENDYPWIEPMNENGGRRILPFSGMTIGDAYLWAKYRDHDRMVQRLEAMTRRLLATPAGSYGHVGSHCIIKNTRTLHNVAVLSDEETPTRIEDCIVLADGVVGYGCTCEYGCIAMRFVLGEHVHLEFGVRLNDTVVGDNSTIARCEVGNNIIFPAHEQHHNNSFLIAALVQGQSNVAAGATLGSNHNGRTADGEMSAGRGFWPGLCVSIKHNCRFASYTLLAKGDYPSELNITLPFALVNNNVAKNRLEVMPAYWWMHNMYALDRNSTKFARRDKRTLRQQHIEFSPLAPDTAEEMLVGRGLLYLWTTKAYQNGGQTRVVAHGMERGKRETVILKPGEAYRAYEEMLVYYAMAQLDGTEHYDGERTQRWVNIGGQLVAGPDMDRLTDDVEQGRIASWEELHRRMDTLWAEYPEQKRRHAYGVLCELAQKKALDAADWHHFKTEYARIRQLVRDRIATSRQKDADNEFRQTTFWNTEEMAEVMKH